MKIDETVIKISVIMIAQRLIAILKQNSQRWIVREWFTKGEMPFLKWFNWGFLTHLSTQQLLGLGIIAGFTVITFPLGLWMGSFNIGESYAISQLIGIVINLITFPITLYTMAYVLGELQFNRTTWGGVWLIIVGQFILGAGCWLIYAGNKGGV